MKKRSEVMVEKILGVSFFVTGILMLAAGLLALLFSLVFQKEAQKTDGIITSIGNDTEVVYSINGEEYEARLSEKSSSWHEGDTITLYVKELEPEKVRTADLLYLPTYILCGVGLPFCIVGAVFLGIMIKRDNKRKRLLQTGQRIFAEVTGGYINLTYQVGRRHPYRLECKYTDAVTGAEYLFSSGNIWLDPQLYLGKQVAVYLDRADFSKYYVDAESLTGSAEVYDFR